MASLPFSAVQTQHLCATLPEKTHKTIQTNLPKPHFRQTNHLNSHTSYYHNMYSLCRQGRVQAAFDLLTEMDVKNIVVGPEIYGLLLQECVYQRNLFTGQQIHARVIKHGDLLAGNEYIETKLFVFYAKCDLFDIAMGVHRRLRIKNVFSWAAMIGLCCRMGFNAEALMGFSQMIESGISADNFVIPNVVKACGALQWVGFGRTVHGYALKMGLNDCVFVSSSVADMYGKCGVLRDARDVFDNMPERNVVAWNSMIGGCILNGFDEEGIRLFYDMRLEDVEPSRVTLLSFLSASANLGAIEEGKQGHAVAVLCGFELDSILGSSILNFYSKVGLIEDAESVFGMIEKKDVVAWNLLISTYVQCEQVEKALNMCRLMRSEHLKFDSVTLDSILSASAKMKNVELGKEGHGYCVRNNLDSNLTVARSIVDMYTECERIDDARQVFNSAINKDIVMWNTLLTAYVEQGLIGEAFKLFYQMQLEGVPANVMSWNAVVLGLLISGQIDEARDVFSEMLTVGLQPNLLMLIALISGLVHNSLGDKERLEFKKIQESGMRPCPESLISTISACTSLASSRHGRAIHGYILRHDQWLSIPISNDLVDMYVRCGQLSQAK